LVVINDKFNTLGSSSRYFVVTGGRGSAKSFSVTCFLLLLTYESEHTILFTRYTLTSAHISIIPEFLEKIELLGKHSDFHITKDEIVNITTGSKILFKGIKTSSGTQTANLKSLQGVTTWVLDEAEELIDEDIFDKIDLSIRHKTKQNRVILILNPATKEHFIYQKFFESKGIQDGYNIIKGDTTYIHTTYIDNLENLSESFINQIEYTKQHRPEKYKHVILGGWLDKAEGVIFSNWTIGAFEEHSLSVYGQDYGFSNDPTTLVQTSIDKKNKRIYLKEHLYQTNLTTSQIAEINNTICGNSLIVSDCAEPRLISELKSKKNNIVEAIKGQGSVTYGIALLQDYDLIIDNESINLIKELNNYCWLEKKSKTPIDMYNHLIDAVRYSIGYQLANPNKGQYSVY
jgi:phage terminase large subunit